MSHYVLAAGFAWIATGSGALDGAEKSLVWPEQEWATAAPADVGLDVDHLNEARDRAGAERGPAPRV